MYIITGNVIEYVLSQSVRNIEFHLRYTTNFNDTIVYYTDKDIDKLELYDIDKKQTIYVSYNDFKKLVYNNEVIRTTFIDTGVILGVAIPIYVWQISELITYKKKRDKDLLMTTLNVPDIIAISPDNSYFLIKKRGRANNNLILIPQYILDCVRNIGVSLKDKLYVDNGILTIKSYNGSYDFVVSDTDKFNILLSKATLMGK